MRVKTFIAVGAVVAIVGGVFAYMEYNRKPAGADDATPKHTVTAEQLFTEFQQDEAAAQAKYVGQQEQVIQVNGTIREIGEAGNGATNIILETGDPMAGIVCEFKSNVPSTWKAGDQVGVKGFCQGMLMDVVLQRCVAAQ
jgi:hypothetical protein